MKHYDYEISLFIDSELDRYEQKELFNHLAECEDCMTLFSEMNALKYKIKDYYETINPEVRFTENKKAMSSFKKSLVPTLSFAIIIFMSIVLILNYNERNKLLNKYKSLDDKLTKLEKIYSQKIAISEFNVPKDSVIQNHTKSDFPATKKAPKINTSIKKELQRNRATFTRGKQYAEYLNSLQVEKVTSDDFLIPQMIGN